MTPIEHVRQFYPDVWVGSDGSLWVPNERMEGFGGVEYSPSDKRLFIETENLDAARAIFEYVERFDGLDEPSHVRRLREAVPDIWVRGDGAVRLRPPYSGPEIRAGWSSDTGLRYSSHRLDASFEPEKFLTEVY